MTQRTTQHTCNGGPRHQRKTPGCPRCDALLARAAAARAAELARTMAEMEITLENTLIYPDSPCPAVHKSVWESWARGEWAGNDESWFTELAEMGLA